MQRRDLASAPGELTRDVVELVPARARELEVHDRLALREVRPASRRCSGRSRSARGTGSSCSVGRTCRGSSRWSSGPRSRRGSSRSRPSSSPSATPQCRTMLALGDDVVLRAARAPCRSGARWPGRPSSGAGPASSSLLAEKRYQASGSSPSFSLLSAVRRSWSSLRRDDLVRLRALRGRNRVVLEVVELEARRRADDVGGAARVVHARQLDDDLVCRPGGGSPARTRRAGRCGCA